MTIWIKWWLFFTVATSWAAEPLFEFSLTPSTIAPGERAHLVLRLNPNKYEREDFPDAQDSALIQAPGVELLDQSFTLENGVFVWTYAFTAYHPSEVALPPVEVRWGPYAFSSQRVFLTTALNDPSDELQPYTGPVSAPWRWTWLGWALASVALLAAWLKRPRSAPRKPAPPPPPDPRNWLKEQLAQLMARAQATPHDPTLHDEWAVLIREYATRSLDLPVPAWTTRQMSQRLANTPPWPQMIALFDECDSARFKPPGHKQPLKAGEQTALWIKKSVETLS